MDISDFENAITSAGEDTHKQLTATDDGGVTLKSSDRTRRLATWATGGDKTADKNLIQQFRTALEQAYGPQAAQIAWDNAGLAERFQKGQPLSTGVAANAIKEAKTTLILQKNMEYEQGYRHKNEEALAWNPSPRPSQVDGNGMRLVIHEQDGVRIQNWNSRNDIRKTEHVLELDELVDKEVTVLRQERQEQIRLGQNVPPLSDRLLYLQAKLNITERMVVEATKPENLRPGGPTANVFLGPDMFFCPSDGPVVDGIKTYGGALTEEEMKQFTRGLAEISRRHPEVTMMPGTFVWSKPASTVPQVGGLPRPSDMVFNNGPVFCNGELKHITVKKIDGGDADWAGQGINGVDLGGYVAPSQANGFGARLQVFGSDNKIQNHIGNDGVKATEGVRQELHKLSAPDSPGRTWEDGLRTGGALARSPYNHLFVVEDKVMGIEICADHSGRKGQTEYMDAFNNPNAQDPVITLARQQPGIRGGANVHVVLSASTATSPNSTFACDGGTLAQNDVSGGKSFNVTIVQRQDENSVTFKGKNQDFYKQHLKPQQDQALNPNDLKLDQSRQVKLDDSQELTPDDNETKLRESKDLEESVDLEEEHASLDLEEVETLQQETRMEESPSLKRHPSVRDLIKPGSVANAKASLGLDQPQGEQQPKLPTRKLK